MVAYRAGSTERVLQKYLSPRYWIENSDQEIFIALRAQLKFIRRLKKNRAIKSYVKRLPGLLAKDYGRSAHYRPLQIKRTIERAGLDPIYSCYAIAMFSGRDDFIQFHTDIGETCDYDAMRAEIAHNHFSGDANFGVGDIVNLYSEHGSDASHPGSHDSGSGHGGH